MCLPLKVVVHHDNYHVPSDDEINTSYSGRNRVWDTVPDSRKEKLAEQEISGIAQALSVHKFSPKIVEKKAAEYFAF